MACLEVGFPTGLERIGLGLDRHLTTDRRVAGTNQPQRGPFGIGRKYPVPASLSSEIALLDPRFSFVRMSATGPPPNPAPDRGSDFGKDGFCHGPSMAVCPAPQDGVEQSNQIDRLRRPVASNDRSTGIQPVLGVLPGRLDQQFAAVLA